MKLLFCFLLNFFLFTYGLNSISIVRAPGDVLYQNCQNVTIAGQKVNDACVILSEADDCGLNVALNVAGQQIFIKEMDLELAPEVCGQYSSCQFCISILLDKNNNSIRCVTVTPKCGLTLPSIDAGCFPEEVLDGIVSCQDAKCPNDCSGHGTCNNGVCQCNEDYYGEDCSSSGQLFFYCRKLDDLTGNLCVRVSFLDCSIGVTMLLEGGGVEVPMYDNSYPISQFKQIFQAGQCADLGVCSACIAWDNLTLTETYAGGCGSVSITCPGMSDSYQIGCFEDNNIIPDCFGSCPNNCTGTHGTCDNGICHCNGQWSGDDCSVISGCPGGGHCSGHGTCQISTDGNGRICHCDDGYAGTDCSIKKPSTTTGSSDNNNNGSKPSKAKIAAVVIPIIIIIAGAVVFAIWYTRRNRKLTPQFTQLDLITAEDDDDDEGLRSD